MGLKSYINNNQMNLAAEYRLAFRELGLSIGLKGILIINYIIKKRPEFTENSLNKRFNDIKEYQVLGNIIEEFWVKNKNRKTNNWKEHQDINTVMLVILISSRDFLSI